MTVKLTPNWRTILKRRGSLLFESLVARGQSRKFYQEMFGFDFELRNRKYLAGNIILDLNETDILRKLLESEIQKNREYLVWLAKKHYDQCERILNIAEKIFNLSNISTLKNSELQYWFIQYVENVLKLMPSLMAMPTIEKFLEEKISKIVKEKLTKSGRKGLLEKYINALIIPRKENFVAKELREIFALSAEIQSDRFLSKIFNEEPEDIIKNLENRPALLHKLQNHAEKFGFLNMYTYEGNPLTVEDVAARIKECLRQNCVSKLKEIEKEKLESENRCKAIISELELDVDAKKLIELAQEYLYLRLYRLDVLNIAGFKVRKLLGEIARRMNLTYEDIIYLSHEEILSFFATGRKPDKELINQRKKDYGTLLVDGEFKIVSGDELEREKSLEKEVVKEIPKNISLLEGTVASLGKHIGRVKVVLYNPDINKVEKGDVIVSTMTNPYYVPAMIRAGAIVTDEGGILSHAAIVSRELGIPCIIGTHIATKVLKDNDLVEVDATGLKGIVRILETCEKGMNDDNHN